MFRPLISLFFVLSLSLMIGCASSGKNFNTSKIQNIKNNVTTQTHILDWFGVPYIEGVNNGRTMWTYQFDTYSAVGQDKSKDLVIIFDDNNVVKAYRFTSNFAADL